MNALNRLREALAGEGSVSFVSPPDQEPEKISPARAPNSRQQNSNPPPPPSENLKFLSRGTDRTDKTPLPRWVDMPDVVTAVEDLADQNNSAGQISRLLGLTRPEVVTILRRTGR